MKIREERKKLSERDKKLEREEDEILAQIEKDLRYSEPLEKKFPSKVAAMQFVLANSTEPVHSKVVAARLVEMGFLGTTERKISGILRRYSSEGRIFRAEGGNRFTVLDK